MIEKARNFFTGLFSHHFIIERFGIMFGLLLLLMTGCLLSIGAKHKGDQKEQLGAQAVYSTEFTMSRSKAHGSVVSVNTSSDKTKTLVLLKYDDPTMMSTDAADYSMFLTGSDTKQIQHELLCDPQGSVYVFGNSGYVVLYLIDVNGFQSQILNMTLRSDNEFATGDALEDARDASFSKHDQMRIYFNPGASGATTVDCLEDGNMDPYHIYESVLIKEQEAEIKVGMESALKDLQQAQVHIEAAEKTVTDKGLQVPVAPYWIAGDAVMDDGSGNLELYAAVNLPGSHMVDWRGGSIATGYMDDVLASTGYAQATDYFAAKREEGRELQATLNVNETQWYRIDGTSVQRAATNNGLSTAEQLLNDAMKSLEDAWSEFYDAKINYTITLPGELLNLEAVAQDITSNYTVRTFTDDVPNESQVLWTY